MRKKKLSNLIFLNKYSVDMGSSIQSITKLIHRDDNFVHRRTAKCIYKKFSLSLSQAHSFIVLSLLAEFLSHPYLYTRKFYFFQMPLDCLFSIFVMQAFILLPLLSSNFNRTFLHVWMAERIYLYDRHARAETVNIHTQIYCNYLIK